MNVHSRQAMSANILSSIPRNGFSKSKVLVIGDLMLDRYVLGEVTRISPEAPVPVLAVREERSVAGGAANVAMNVAGLQAKVMVAGVIGRDTAGARLLEMFLENNIDDSGVVQDMSRPTTCKTRVMCNNHQIVRMDNEVSEDLTSEVSAQFSARVLGLLDKGIDAVI